MNDLINSTDTKDEVFVELVHLLDESVKKLQSVLENTSIFDDFNKYLEEHS